MPPRPVVAGYDYRGSPRHSHRDRPSPAKEGGNDELAIRIGGCDFEALFSLIAVNGSSLYGSAVERILGKLMKISPAVSRRY